MIDCVKGNTYYHEKRVTEQPFPRVLRIEYFTRVEAKRPVIPIQDNLIIDELIARSIRSYELVGS